MKVLVGCEFSQVVTRAFRAKGHTAFSCDTVPTEGNPEWHIQGDVLDHLDEGWDVGIFHPPCTHLCVSGARWFVSGHKPISLREDSIIFVKKLMDSNIPKIALENPVGVLSSRIRKPEQIIRPCMFGDDSRKATCLWLKNLPPLKPTKEIVASVYTSRSGRKWDKWFFDSSLIHDLKKRSKFRSTTFQGIANAMADQWSSLPIVPHVKTVENLGVGCTNNITQTVLALDLTVKNPNPHNNP